MNEKELYITFEQCYHINGQPYRVLRSYVELDTYDKFVVEYQLYEVEYCKRLASVSQTVHNTGFSQYKLRMHSDMDEIISACTMLQLAMSDEIQYKQDQDKAELETLIKRIHHEKLNQLKGNS